MIEDQNIKLLEENLEGKLHGTGFDSMIPKA